MSFSWVEPHLATLYARREEHGFAEQLPADGLPREERLPELGATVWRRSSWLETTLQGSHTFRLS